MSSIESKYWLRYFGNGARNPASSSDSNQPQRLFQDHPHDAGTLRTQRHAYYPTFSEIRMKYTEVREEPVLLASLNER